MSLSLHPLEDPMGALDYRVDLQDIRFVLFDQLEVDKDLAEIEAYEDFDRDMYDAMIDEAHKIAVEVLAPLNSVGDRQGCTLDGDGNVTTPTGFKEAWDLRAEGGWVSVTAPQDAGGVGMPAAMGMAVIDMFIGAAMAFEMYPGLTAAAANVVREHAPEAWRLPYAEKMYTGQWGGTMCLTESGAGSDVGENRCKATPQDDGSYLLVGEKIFISGGDQDFTENIIHLVLARTPDSPPGTKGLSLFLVPKFLVNDDLSSGERNGAYVASLEHKMGINGSATCVLELGGRAPCKGWLVGKEHEGIRIMFQMMNEARIGCGAQGVATANAAYQYALAYAKEREQGSSVDNWKDPAAPRVTITQHPDVRRMLMTMKVLSETMRSMLYKLGHRHDLAHHDEKLADKFNGRVDLLVPVLKAHCTDRGFDVCVTGVQVLGGYGYTGEYPLEQLVRDTKITSIYEGTNGIQAMDLLGRKLRQKGGALLMEWMQDNLKACKEAKEHFPDEAVQLEKAINHVGQTAMHLGGLGAQGKLESTLLQATPFLEMFGTVQLGLEALEQAQVAKRVIEQRGESAFLKGKLLNLRFYTNNLLPKAVALGKAIQNGDDSCLDEVLFA
jgi:alkylation response protein AidB-like acyl-CoA dehydrogenase